MPFEHDLAALNECYFYHEFAYSNNTFHQADSQEVELADTIIWIGDICILFQLKERVPPPRTPMRVQRSGGLRRRFLVKQLARFATLIVTWRNPAA